MRASRIRLAPSQIREFFETGFVVLPDRFRPDEMAQMRAAFERLERTARKLRRSTLHCGSRFVLERAAERHPVRIQRIVWCGAAEPVLLAFGNDPRLVVPAAQLLDSGEMQHLINQAHFKLPGDGVHFPWHQDSSNRRYGGNEWRDLNGKGSYVQTVVALDDTGPENGALQFIPGSQRLGHVTQAEDGTFRIPEKLIDTRRAVTPTMRSGDVLLFGPFVFHASAPNRSQAPRRVFINGYAYPGANSRVYPGAGSGRLLRAPAGWDRAPRARG